MVTATQRAQSTDARQSMARQEPQTIKHKQSLGQGILSQQKLGTTQHTTKQVQTKSTQKRLQPKFGSRFRQSSSVVCVRFLAEKLGEAGGFVTRGLDSNSLIRKKLGRKKGTRRLLKRDFWSSGLRSDPARLGHAENGLKVSPNMPGITI